MKLREITDIEYNYWIMESLVQQAKDKAYSNGTKWTDELEQLCEILPNVLPKGYRSKGHIFKVIDVDEFIGGGFIWFGPLPNMQDGSIFLYDIMLNQECRSKGYGRKILTLMHQELKSLGYKTIMLHVLRSNYAMNLYQSLGYKEINGGEHYAEMIFYLS